MPEEDPTKWTIYTMPDNEGVELVPPGKRRHILGGKCWCQPVRRWYCDCFDDVDNEPDPKCWKCQGEGMLDDGQPDGPTMLEHNTGTPQ